MEKPIIATALKGLFIKGDSWEKAHIIWYEDREKEIKKWNRQKKQDLIKTINPSWNDLAQNWY